MDDWHATQLVDHVLNTIGRALLIAAAVAVAGVAAAMIDGAPFWAYVGAVAAAVAVGFVLWVSTAPAPLTEDETADEPQTA